MPLAITLLSSLRAQRNNPVFQRLQNPGFFALAGVDYGTVVWPGDVDIAPETLYAESVIVGAEFLAHR